MEVKLLIDGEEVLLEKAEPRESRGETSGPYEVYREPSEYLNLGVGKQPLIVTVHKRRGWKPSDGIK